MSESIPVWFYALAAVTLSGLVSAGLGWWLKVVWAKIIQLEQDLTQVKLVYVSQRQFDRVVDQQRQDAQAIEDRLDKITEMLVKLSNAE